MRLLLALAGSSCLLAAVGAQAPAPALAAGPTAADTSQELAVLLSGHAVHRRPRGGSDVLVTVPAVRPITGERTALPVIGHAHSGGGIAWLRVMLPGRPNGSSGWIAKQGTRTTSTGWRITVSLGARRVTVYRHGRAIRRFAAVVGKSSTPTPTGSFFVEETLRMTSGEPGGPYALALSARSDALQEFEGGPGQIALHGRDNLGGVLGAAESHGCVRLATASIDWLARRIGPGVPVRIYAG
ncbi:MAG TPA: L,D-transpeptidase [Solirubrobacteraceae bacterium]|nr:L,D-transpeptidase [Solirubrobacteraceae bacterium]